MVAYTEIYRPGDAAEIVYKKAHALVAAMKVAIGLTQAV